MPTIHSFLCLPLLALAFAAQDGILVVLNKSDHTASLVDRASGETLATLPTGAGPHEVAVTADGRRAFVANYGGAAAGNSLTVLDLAKRDVETTWTFEGWSRPHGLALSPGERWLYVTSEGSRTLEIVETETGKSVASIPTGAQVSHMVALSPSTGRAFVANIGSGSVTVFDLERGARLAEVRTGRGAEGIAVTPDGCKVWASNRAEDTISVIDARTLDVAHTLEAKSFPIRVAITPDGETALVSLARSGEVAFFSVRERRETGRVAIPAEGGDAEGRLFGGQFGKSPVPVGLLVPPDGREAFVACTQSDQVFAIDLSSRKVVREIRAGKEPDGLGFAPAIRAAPDPTGATTRPARR